MICLSLYISGILSPTGLQKTQNQERDPKNKKLIFSRYKNTWNWAKTLPYLPIVFYWYPFSTLCGVIHTLACFRSSAPTGLQKKTKTENARPQNNKTNCISIKTLGTGLKLCHTSQSYLSIPFFYPIWGNTHSSMFRSSALTGFQKTQNQERDPKNKKLIVSR